MPRMVDYVVEAERLGATSVWLPEFWAHDALTPLGALAHATETIKLGTAIVQLGTRTPAMLAMSAMTLQELSNGRFVLGIGVSGPQVMEGWHGVRFSKPVLRTRETIEIIRMVTRGERLDFPGEAYRLPLPDGEGVALRSAALPVDVPVYVASLGPTNLRLTGAIADGWIGNSFLCESADVFFEEIAAGALHNPDSEVARLLARVRMVGVRHLARCWRLAGRDRTAGRPAAAVALTRSPAPGSRRAWLGRCRAP